MYFIRINAERKSPVMHSTVVFTANVSCMTTGPSCVRSCAGRNGGNFQSCTSCSKYISCSSHGGMLLEMPCPSGSKWDNLAKTCRKRSRTCIPCAGELRDQSSQLLLLDTGLHYHHLSKRICPSDETIQ